MSAGEPEADIPQVKKALRKLHDIMGVRNFVNAMNDTTLDMSKRRKVLLEELCNKAVEAVPQRGRHAESLPTSRGVTRSSESVDQFRKSFPPLSFSIPAVLDFDGRDDKNNPIKPEGWAKRHLLHQTSGDSRVVAIHGIGGVGKSTILQALATDEDIRMEFSDGVHAMKLGQDATKRKLFEEICRVLKASGAEKEEQCLRKRNFVDEALDEFERWFEKRHCAFLIDDAWTHGIEKSALHRPCKVAYAKGRNSILITTRENEIASLAPSSRTVHVKARDARGTDSREILFFHADYKQGSVMSETTEKAINGILDTGRGLPVGLSVAGKNVKNMKIGMSDADAAWKIFRRRMSSYPSILWMEVDEYRGLFPTFATSLDSLDERRSRSRVGLDTELAFNVMYRRLCVVPKHEVAPGAMLRYLWETKSIAQAEIVATYFIEMGLARREVGISVGEDQQCGLSLYDSLHDFAVTEADRHEERREAHESVLAGYSSCDERLCSELNGMRKWWCPELVEDGYIHRNLCRHLRGAGLEKEVVSLLMMPPWGARQLEMNGILSLQDDFSIGIKATQEGRIDSNETRRFDTERTLEALSESFNMAWAFACSQNRRELWFQVHGRLVGLLNELMGIREYLKRITDEEKRPCLRSTNCVLSGVNSRKGKIISIGLQILCLSVTKGSERVVCGGSDGSLCVVNLRSGETEKQWKAHENGVLNIAIGRNGSRLISVSLDKSAKVWDMSQGSYRCVATFAGHNHFMNCFAVMGDGERVVTGGVGNTAHVWEVETGRVVAEPFRGHTGRVRCVTVLGDGDHVVTGGDDKMLRLWNTKSGAQVGKPFVGHERTVIGVTVSPNGKYAVSASLDGTVRTWDIRSRKEIGEPLMSRCHFPFSGGVSVSRDGSRIASVSHDPHAIRVWDIASRKEACSPLKDHTDHITSVSFLTDRDSIVSCSRDGTVRLWNLQRNNTGRVNRHAGSVTSLAFTPDGSRVVSASKDCTLRIWDVTSGQQIGVPLRGHDSEVSDVSIMPDGERAVSVSWDKTIRVWDMKSCKILHELTDHNDAINCVALTPNGDYAVTGSEDGTVRVWDLLTMDSSHSVLADSFRAHRVFVTDDGKRVVCVDYRGVVLVVERKTRQRIAVKKPTDLGYHATRMSRKQIMDLAGETTMHDDAGLLIPHYQFRISYRDKDEKAVLATLENMISSWALSPDKKKLCVGLMDGTVGFFRLENM